jgi:hypothetical protein
VCVCVAPCVRCVRCVRMRVRSDELVKMIKQMRRTTSGMTMDETEQVEHLYKQLEAAQPRSRAYYRVNATRKVTGRMELATERAPHPTGPRALISELENSLAHKLAGAAKVGPHAPLGKVMEDEKTVKPAPGLSVVEFAAETYAIFENAKQATVRVLRVGAPEKEVDVHYETVDGTASAGSDYEGKKGTLTFKPGVFEHDITVNIFDDDDMEEDEWFAIRLELLSGDAVRARALRISAPPVPSPSPSPSSLPSRPVAVAVPIITPVPFRRRRRPHHHSHPFPSPSPSPSHHIPPRPIPRPIPRPHRTSHPVPTAGTRPVRDDTHHGDQRRLPGHLRAPSGGDQGEGVVRQGRGRRRACAGLLGPLLNVLPHRRRHGDRRHQLCRERGRARVGAPGDAAEGDRDRDHRRRRALWHCASPHTPPLLLPPERLPRTRLSSAPACHPRADLT